MRKKVKRTIKSLNGLLLKEQTVIIKIASLLIIPTILTKITGQVFNLVVAAMYGTSTPLSLFIVADALPQTVANIFLFGVVGAIVIPIFVEAKDSENKEVFLDFYSTVFNLALISFGIAGAIIFLFADKLMPFVLNYLIDPNQIPSPEDIGLVVNMMRALFIPQIFLGASVFIGSGLNVYNRFLLPQLSPLFYNFGMLIGAIVFVPLLDKSPWALVIGVILGSILHFLVPIPLARSLGLQVRLKLDLKSKYVRKLARVALPRLVAFSAEQVSGMATKFITFGYNYAFPVAQYYASSIINAIPAIFGYTFAVASYPTLAALYNKQKYAEFGRIINKTINQIVFLTIPFVVTLIILRLPVVRLIYGLLQGAFDRESTYMTAWLILFLGIGVIFITLRGFVYRVFYATQNTRLPLLISLISMVITIGGGILFSNYFSHFNIYSIRELTWDPSFFFEKANGKAAIAGVGLSSSLAAMFEVLALLIIFHFKIMEYDWRSMIDGLIRKLIPGAVMAVLMFVMYKMWNGLDALPVDADPGFDGSTTLNLIILTAITVSTSTMVYYLLCLLFKVEELRIMKRFLNPLFKVGGLEIK